MTSKASSTDWTSLTVSVKGRTIRKVMGWGGGGGVKDFQLARFIYFFFRPLLVQEFFCR